MAIEPIKGFYVHDEETNTNGVAKVSIEAVQEFEDDIRDETSKWLDEHPEATTTVQDGAIIESKIDPTFLSSIKNWVVTPGMFGAKGDGATVDNIALNDCFAFCVEHGTTCDGLNKTYLIDGSTASYADHYGVKVPGGCTVQNLTAKLADTAGDMCVPLACLYNDNDYFFENCHIEGVLRSPTVGREDGGNHGIIFCDGSNMFPANWQTAGRIVFENCNFDNIQCYGIFPTPFDNDLILTNCVFNCHGPGALTYATNTLIENCKYNYLSSSGTTTHCLSIDEIENFSAPSAIKKNVTIRDSKSSNILYNLQHNPQRGVIYGNIKIEHCHAGSYIAYVYDSEQLITLDLIEIADCTSDANGGSGSYCIQLNRINGNVLIDNVRFSTYGMTISNSTIPVFEIKNTTFNNWTIITNGVTINRFVVENCALVGTQTGGFITGKYGSTYGVITNVFLLNIVIMSTSRILFNNTITNVFVVGLACARYAQLIFNDTAQATNLYVDGLIMPEALPSWTYFAENLTGKVIIRGMAPSIATYAVGTPQKDFTAIT